VTAEIKQVIWTAIGQSITNQWEYIDAIYEQIGLIGRAKKELYRARNALGNMADLAPKMIEVLNYRTGSQLIKMGIANRTETISIIKRTTTMKNLIQTLDRKIHDIQADITKFQNRFTALQDKGLPSLEESGQLLSHEKYIKRVSTFAAIQIADTSGSSSAGPLTGQALFNKLDNLFFIKNEVAHLFDEPPHFFKYTEADETIGSILRHQLPPRDIWQDLIKLLLNQS
jgi:prefoldin subunit 5